MKSSITIYLLMLHWSSLHSKCEKVYSLSSRSVYITRASQQTPFSNLETNSYCCMMCTCTIKVKYRYTGIRHNFVGLPQHSCNICFHPTEPHTISFHLCGIPTGSAGFPWSHPHAGF